ncbi:hypothetical protein K2W90_05545 [Candidatus Babeliales bacterium]|nr:hypothetical protein [Candidatus Babeliales bacterium]
MKKLLLTSVLVFGLGVQHAACTTATNYVQADVEALIAYAQQNNLSAAQTLKLAQESIDQAAHFDDFNVEVKQDNKQKMLIIAGVVVVVVVVAGVAYYYYNKNKKITTARQAAEEMLKKLDSMDLDSMDSVEEFEKELETLQKREDLSDEEVAHFLRACEKVVGDCQGAVLRAGLSGKLRTPRDAKEFVKQYFRESLLKGIDESYKKGFTPEELAEIKEQAARGRAKQSR